MAGAFSLRSGDRTPMLSFIFLNDGCLPSRRRGATIALAIAALLFGGCAPEWLELHPPAPLPAPRWQHRAAFDRGSNRMIVFAGKIPTSDFATDVWLLEDPAGA